MEILTNTSVVAENPVYVYTAEKLSTDSYLFENGDGTLVVQPFDSYVMIDLQNEDPKGNDGEIDFSSVGNLYLTFSDDTNTVKIKNFNGMKNIDPSKGQVVFKITSSDSQKIMQLKRKYFFLSSVYDYGNGKAEETALFSGIWQSADEEIRTPFAIRIADKQTKLEYLTEELKKLTEETDTEFQRLRYLQDSFEKESFVADNYKNRMIELSTLIDKIENEIAKITSTQQLDKINKDLISSLQSQQKELQKITTQIQEDKKKEETTKQVVQNPPKKKRKKFLGLF